MRKNHISRLFFSILTIALVMAGVSRATTVVSLSWDPSPDADKPNAVAAYKVYYSTHPLTNLVAGGTLDSATFALNVGNHTNATINGLLTGWTYHFAVTAVSPAGIESEFCDELTYVVPGDMVPELPSLGDGSGTVPLPPPGSITDTNTSSGSSQVQTVTDTPTQLNLVGLLPRMWMARSNGSPTITLGGAVGATFTVQVATNITGFEEWTTVTNVRMSTVAPNTQPPTGNALNKAFVPSLETWTDSDGTTNSTDLKFYRIYMPYGYAVVADQVLKPQGYNTRLIAVRLAALNAYIVCYVTEEGIYLDYNDTTFIVKTQQSGPTIREVATTVSTVLGQNWTSASEFTVTDGVKQILATVVQTDSPLSDPPLGSSGGVSIAIDF